MMQTKANRFIWPALVYVTVVVILPLGYATYLSFHSCGSGLFGREFVGFENYGRLLGDDPRFFNSVKNTFYYTTLAVILESVLGVALALFLNRSFVLKGTVQALVLLPFVMTPTASALIWRLLLGTGDGYVNEVLETVALGPVPWLTSTELVIPSLVLIDVWQWTPFMTMIFLAALAALPTDIYEAAEVDGAGPWARTRLITLPLLRPAIVVAAAVRATDALKTFDHIFVLTDGGPANASETMNIYAFKSAFRHGDFSYAAAVVLAFFMIVMMSVLVVLRFRRAQP